MDEYDEEAEIAKCRAAIRRRRRESPAGRLLSVLRAVEWSDQGYVRLQMPREPAPRVTYFQMCPACWHGREDGHDEGCELLDLMNRLKRRLADMD
jgi:hypothetical protein